MSIKFKPSTTRGRHQRRFDVHISSNYWLQKFMANRCVLNRIAKECLNNIVVYNVKPEMAEITDNYTVLLEIVEISARSTQN